MAVSGRALAWSLCLLARSARLVRFAGPATEDNILVGAAKRTGRRRARSLDCRARGTAPGRLPPRGGDARAARAVVGLRRAPPRDAARRGAGHGRQARRLLAL